MRNFLRRTLIVSAALVGLGAPAHADKTFNIGSLVIPPGAAYQSECGSVAVYGLVYDVLRANAWLEANKAALCPTHTASQTCAIEVHYSVKMSKGSPNRCTPTNLDAGPAYPLVPAPLHSDPVWNDGCDFEITNPAATPVRRVNNVAPFGVDSDIVTTATTGMTEVFPQFPTRTITSPAVSTVRYLGGPFVIDAIDAPVFLKLLSGTLPAPGNAGMANDNALGTGNWVDFTPFRTGLGACAFGTSNGGYVNIHRTATVFTAPVVKTFSAAPPRVALLATTQGATTINMVSTSQRNLERRSNTGVIGNGTYITYKTTNNHGFVPGDFVVVSGVITDGGACGAACLANYNSSGGNAFQVFDTPTSRTFRVPSAVVLAVAGRGTATRVGAFKNTATGLITIRTAVNHGFTAPGTVIVDGTDDPAYDGTRAIASVPDLKTLTFADAPGALAASGGGDVSSSGGVITKKVSDGILQKYLRSAGLEFAGAGGCPPFGTNVGNVTKCPLGGVRGQIYDTFDIADIAAVPTKLDPAFYKMIWTPHWETYGTAGAAPTAGEIDAIGKISSFLDGQTGLMAECHSIEAFEGALVNGVPDEQGVTPGQFQTCVKGAGSTLAAPVCSAATTVFGVNKNPPNPPNNTYYPNCSDPALVNGAACTYFGFPGDPFAQPGDFSWKNKSGSVQAYLPKTAAPETVYEAGVLPLISGVLALDRAKLADPITARTMISSDYATRNTKDNDTAKANILYMAGHDVSGVVSGTKVILQTLLLLGEPPIVTTTEEVSRASPIVFAIGGVTAIVQGSFEQLTPAGSTSTADLDGDVAGFEFPDVIGHMRAVATTNVGVRSPDPTKIADLVEIFDAANALPSTTNSYSPGCGLNAFGQGAGNCRTIFTHTATGMAPPRVVLEAASAANVALKTAINLGGATIDVEFPTFLQRIIAGFNSGGTYVPKLGGVDRSTVAVIPASAVAGSPSRPTVIYFGATDGMLHAVCGSLSPPITVGTPDTGVAPCDTYGRELWAFVPRLQLSNLRKNTARVDGSPRVLDVFADLDGPGPDPKSFKTLLVFQTTSGTPGSVGKEPSMTALDITDPTDPKIAWDFPLPGQGLVVNVGRVSIGGVSKYLAFAQTNNGLFAAGNVVTAVDVETGTELWKTGGPTVGASYVYTPGTAPSRTSGATVPPITGIPGGAVGIDTQRTGSITDVVFGTLYGDIWQVDAKTGANRYGASPLFQYSTDEHPIGAPLTIFGDGSLYGLAVPGGYADLAAAPLWSAMNQTAVAVKLYPLLTSGTPLNESSGAPGVKWTLALDAGDKAYSQAVVSGGEVYITTDSLDANSLAYGSLTGDSGKVYKVSLAETTALTAADVVTYVVAGGAGSVATSGSGVFNVSKNSAEKLGVTMDTDGTLGVAVGSQSVAKVTRKMWLRTL